MDSPAKDRRAVIDILFWARPDIALTPYFFSVPAIDAFKSRCAVMSNKAAKRVIIHKGDVIAHIYHHEHDLDVMAACKITRQALAQWIKVPATRVLTVEKITGIPRHRIRPDVFPVR